MTKEYQYPFNEAIFREKMSLLLDLNLKQGRSKIGNYLIFIALCITFGIGFHFLSPAPKGTGLYLGWVLIVVGVFYLAAFIQYLVKINKFQRTFDQQLNAEIERLNSTGSYITIALSDNYFYYSDGDHETRVKWRLFKSYLLFDSHLLLVTSDTDLSGYTLSAFDVNYSDFNEVCTFVETKLEPHYLSGKKSENPENDSDILDS